MTQKEIKNILHYAETLLNIPYSGWSDNNSTEKELHPFYVKSLPKLEYLKEKGINCAGFINIIIHKIGKNIQGKGKYIGGTRQWYLYFKNNKMLKNFEYNHKYPLGTLFIRNYRNKTDEGHMAILYKYNKKKKLKDSILHAYIIHAYNNSQENGGKVGITNLGFSHFSISEGYYDNIVLPQDWLK